MSQDLENLQKKFADRVSARVNPTVVEDFRFLMQHKAGKNVLNFLREITLNTVLAPTNTDAELRQAEGRRELFATIWYLANLPEPNLVPEQEDKK